MPNKINGMSQTHTNRLSQRGQSQVSETSQEASRVAAEPQGDTVELTGTSQKLAGLSKALASQPVVDQAKVEAVRQSLADGSYQIDAEKIAERLVALDRQMGGKQE